MIMCAISSGEEPKKILAICKKSVSDGIGILEFFRVGETYTAYENLKDGYLYTVDDNEKKHIISERKDGNWENDNFLNEHFELIYYTDSKGFQFSVGVVYGIHDFTPDMLQ